MRSKKRSGTKSIGEFSDAIKKGVGKVGRPTVMTQAVVGKLEEAFALGCTDTEACLFAGVSRDSLYELEKKNAEFSDRKKLLKDSPVLKARKALLDAIEGGDGDLALKFLERKKRDEFSLRQEFEHSGNPERPIAVTNIDFSKMSDEELDRYLDEVKKG